MALNQVKIPVASVNKNEQDLSCNHQTSMNFLLAQPVYYRHIPRGEKWSDDLTGVIRPVSLAVPTYGRVRNNLRAFFVPYRLVHSQYDAARANVLAYNYENVDIPIDNPRLPNQVILDYFTSVSIVGVGPLVETLDPTDPDEAAIINADRYDFKLNSDYYRYTAAGRRRLKLLRCLGYEPIWIEDKDKEFQYDCLALMCYAQLYLDWYANSQYLDSVSISGLRQLLSYNDPSNHLELTVSQFANIMNLVFSVVYDSDSYYNMAWDTPVSPTVGQFSVPSVSDLTISDSNLRTSVVVTSNGSPSMRQGATSSLGIGSQYIHDMLHVLTDYQRRHALSGAREIDRALADYGFVSDYAALKRAVYLGNRSFDVQIGDVYSTANTSQSDVSNLGDYAGRGYGAGQGSFEFTADEDGMVIIVSTIIPNGGFVQGYDRNNRHLNIFDMFDPNFEVGVQVLEKGEVYISKNGDFANDITDYTQKFGYTGAKGEYKRPRDWWTSENRCPSVDAGGDSWNLFRLFADSNFSDDIDDLVHSLNFSRATDWESFNRIFQYVNSDRDKFECFYHHEVHTISPCKPLFETYDFKDVHKQIKMDINGSKLN